MTAPDVGALLVTVGSVVATAFAVAGDKVLYATGLVGGAVSAAGSAATGLVGTATAAALSTAKATGAVSVAAITPAPPAGVIAAASATGQLTSAIATSAFVTATGKATATGYQASATATGSDGTTATLTPPTGTTTTGIPNGSATAIGLATATATGSSVASVTSGTNGTVAAVVAAASVTTSTALTLSTTALGTATATGYQASATATGSDSLSGAVGALVYNTVAVVGSLVAAATSTLNAHGVSATSATSGSSSLTGSASAVGLSFQARFASDADGPYVGPSPGPSLYPSPTLYGTRIDQDAATYSIKLNVAASDSITTVDLVTSATQGAATRFSRPASDSTPARDAAKGVITTPQVASANLSATAFLTATYTTSPVFPYSLTDAASAADLLRSHAALPRALAESTGGADGSAGSTKNQRSITEATGRPSEKASRVLAQSRATADTARITDAVVHAASAYARSNTEAAPALDSVSFRVEKFGFATDSAPAADTYTFVRGHIALLTDSTPLTDTNFNNGRAHPRAPSDSASTVDTAKAFGLGATRRPTDAVPLVDASTWVRNKNFVAADAASARDTALRSLVEPRYGADNTLVGREEVATRVPNSARAAGDTAGLVDALARLATESRTATESGATADTLRSPATEARATTDAISLLDTNAFTTLHTRTAAGTDSAPATDSASGTAKNKPLTTLVYSAQTLDKAGATDSSQISVQNVARTGPDAIIGNDNAARRSLALGRSVADSVPAADAARGAFGRIRYGADTAAATDAAAQVTAPKARPAADTAQALDAALGGGPRTRTASDAAPLLDANLGAISKTVFADDKAAAKDALTFGVSYVRAALDATGAIDLVVDKSGLQARTCTDTVATADYNVRGSQVFAVASDSAGWVDALTYGRARQASCLDLVATHDQTMLVQTVIARSTTDTIEGGWIAGDAATTFESSARYASEAAASSDAAAQRLSGVRTTADVLPTPDVCVRNGVTAARSLTEALGGTDLTRGAEIMYRNGLVAIAGIEQVTSSASATRSTADRLRLDDTLSVAGPRSRDCFDAIGGASTDVRALQNIGRNPADAAGGLESISHLNPLFRFTYDQMPLVDAATRAGVSLLRAASEGTSNTDIAEEMNSVYELHGRYGVDQDNGSDAASITSALRRSAADIAGGTAYSSGPTQDSRAFTEATGGADFAGRYQRERRIAADGTMPPADIALQSNAVFLLHGRYGIDAAGGQESVAARTQDVRSTADSVPLIDLVALRSGLTAFAYDRAPTIEGIQTPVAWRRSGQDSVANVDIGNAARNPLGVAVDSGVTYDSTFRAPLNTSRPVVDIAALREQATWQAARAGFGTFTSPDGLPFDPTTINMQPHQENSSFRPAAHGTFAYDSQVYAPPDKEAPDSHPVVVIPNPGNQPPTPLGRSSILTSSSA